MSVYGFFSGPNPAYLTGTTILVPASTWLFVSTGYSRNPAGTVDAKTTMATAHISPLDSGAVASVWNHIFMTAPFVANVCQADFGGNGMTITSPLYVVGNLCLSGQNVAIYEAANSQPIDLQVGGKLVIERLRGEGRHRRDRTDLQRRRRREAARPSPSRRRRAPARRRRRRLLQLLGDDARHVRPDRRRPRSRRPTMLTDYTASILGRSILQGRRHDRTAARHNVFDFAPAANGVGEPNNSGSGSSGGTFELFPDSSYSCLSNSGAAARAS